MSRIAKRRGRGAARSGLIAALDIGSSKIACLIARPESDGEVEVVGIGHQISKGVRNGNIVDMAALEHAVAATVEAAEQLARENVRDVVLGIAGGSPESKLISFDVAIAGHEIGEGDLRRALDPTWLYARQPDDRRIIHTLPVGFSINGNRGVRDPRNGRTPPESGARDPWHIARDLRAAGAAAPSELRAGAARLLPLPRS